MKMISILLIEDHNMFREGLRLLLEAEGDMTVVGQGKTGREAVAKYLELKPDVTVMDIAMPLLNGLQAAQQILKDNPLARILMLSAHNDPEYVEEIITMGASGYLVKQSSAELLGKAIRDVHQGKTFYCPTISKHLRDQYFTPFGKKGLVKNSKNRLTPREAELLQLIAEGLVNKQIASELSISIKTVEKHRQNLMEKLNIHDIAGLTRFAMASGVIESSGKQTPAHIAQRSNRRDSKSERQHKK